jgi:D-alanyl-D-alanine dipeptidase
MPILYKRYLLIGFIFGIGFASCNNPTVKELSVQLNVAPGVDHDTLDAIPVPIEEVGELEQYLIDARLVDIQTISPNTLVELKYSTVDNFMGFDLYGDLTSCYLQPDVAEKLKIANEYLQMKDSTLTLLVYDGVRPRSVQQAMWDTLDMPISEKVKFVSNPKKGSLHNFGAAVDLTIAHIETGEALDMGTPYDFIGIEAYPMKEKQMLEAGRITQEAVDNRKLLRRSMKEGGFFNIQTEWWHFNSCYRKKAIELYEMVEGMSDKEAMKTLAAL